jgi:hypothetical protein
MPRRSADDVAAAYLRTGGKPLEPPPDMEASAKRIWRIIAASRPPDYFNAGSAPLLEAYVEAIVMHRFYTGMWRHDRGNPDYLKAITACNASLSMLATKLRLAITSIDKKSGVLTEKGDLTPTGEPGNVIKADVLFGAGPQRF